MKKQKILLVDDNPGLLKLGKAIFESGGYEVITAADGSEALDLLPLHEVALVVTDILMPNIDGYSLCYFIRNNSKTNNLPIIIYSATYTSKSDETLAFEIGADMFIQKPAGMNVLLDAAKTQISTKKGRKPVKLGPDQLNDVMKKYSHRLIEKLEEKNTELEAAHNELEKSEKRFRALFENNFEAISLRDENGKLMFQSPGAQRIFGYTLEEMKEISSADFYHPEDLKEAVKRLKNSTKHPGQPIYGIQRVRHKKGHYIWTEGTLTNLLDDENVKAVVGNFRDITERINRQKQTEFDRNNLNALVNNTTDMMWSVDRDYRLITSNKAFEDLVKHMSGKTITRGDNVLAAGFNAEQLERWKKFYDHAFTGEIFMITEYTDTPVEFWSEISFYPIREWENIIGTACFSHNITGRKKAEKELRLSEDTRKLIMEAAMDGIVCIDQAGAITFWNSRAEDIFGWNEPEMIGRNLSDTIIPMKYREEHARGMTHLLATGNGVIFNKLVEMTALNKAGKEFPVELTVVPVYPNGELSFCGFIRDITQRKMAEEKIGHINRLYSFISQINQTIVHAVDEEAVYKEVCRITADVGVFSMAWIGHVDEESRKITLVAQSNVPDKELQLFTNVPYDQKGPQAHVMNTRSSFICNDIEHDLQLEGWKHFAAIHNIKSAMVLPITKKGTIVGTFNLYASKKHFFDPQETTLLEGAAEDISFALGVFEKEASRKETEQKLQHSEQHLKQAQSIAHVGSWELNYLTGKVKWSDETCRIYGVPVEDNMQYYQSWLSFIHPEDKAKFIKVTHEWERGKGATDFYHRILRKNGDVRYIFSQAQFEFSRDGRPIGLNGVAHDVTVQKLAEEKIIHVNRLYAFTSQINQAIVRAADDTTIFKDACRIAIEFGKFKSAWISVVDLERKKMGIIANAGLLPQDVSNFADIDYDMNTMAGNVIRTGKYAISNDIENENVLESWKIFARKKGWGSCMITPIKKAGVVVGLFTIASSSKDFFNAEEVALLQEATADISFAVDFFEKEKLRKQAEAQLVHSEIRLKQAQAIAHFGSWELSFATGLALWSEEACRIFGLDINDNLHSFDFWLSFVHPEDVEQVKIWVDEGQKGSGSAAFQHRIILRNGLVKHIFSHSQMELNDHGIPVGIHGVTHDLTEIRKAEKALAQSEENLRLIMNIMPQSIFAKDYNGKYLFANNGFAALYGMTPTELVNKTLQEAIPAKGEAESFLKQDQQVINSGETMIVPDQFFTDHTGKTRAFRTVKVPYTMAGTNERAVLGITEDITEQKNAEAERARMIADIITRNKGLEQFSYIVSHKLRVPVANIMGLAEMIELPGINKGDEKVIIDSLAVSAKKLDEIIIDLNKILQLGQDINEQKETVILSSILDDICLSLQDIIKRENVTIKSDFSPIDQLFTIKGYIYTIFHNLISNSIKYRQPGVDPVIEISSLKFENKSELIFKDNGLGIDLGKMGDMVFGIYKRFHQHVEGKGIGLYIVKTYVDALGGTITINSEVNEGTEFRIAFVITEKNLEPPATF